MTTGSSRRVVSYHRPGHVAGERAAALEHEGSAQRSTALDHVARARQLNPDDDDLRALLRTEFCRRWPDSSRALDAIDRYALLPAGELLRSVLVLRAALAVGGDLERALPAAIGVECVHVGGHVHRDLIDHDDVSLGRVSVHRRFGPERAIVAANALYFSGFALIAECRARGASAEQVAEVTRIQAEAGVEHSRGAELELAIGGDPDHARSEYLRMVRLTSAVPVSAACRIGAVLGGADVEQTRALAGFGENLGMAMRIRDDLAPLRTGGRAGRANLPVALVRDHGTDAECERLRTLWSGEGADAASRQDAAGLLTDSGALTAAQRMADQYTGRARRKLRRLPVGASRDRLLELTRSR